MNKKLILTGIVLLTILSACSERDEEIKPDIKAETSKIEKEQFKVSSKIVIDSLQIGVSRRNGKYSTLRIESIK